MPTSSAPFAPFFLGTRLPLIQAPMAGVQDARLAIAVSNAGGLGSLPAAMLAPDALRKELQALRDGTDKPFNVNFFAHTPPSPDEARETRWRDRLGPYYAEFGIDAAQIPAGPGRQPFTAEIADLVETTQRFYERLLRLDSRWRLSGEVQPSAIERLRERLERRLAS